MGPEPTHTLIYHLQPSEQWDKFLMFKLPCLQNFVIIALGNKTSVRTTLVKVDNKLSVKWHVLMNLFAAKMYRTYLQTHWGRAGVGRTERVALTHTLPCVHTHHAWNRQLVGSCWRARGGQLCDDLGGGKGRGREAHEGGDMTDSRGCMAERNTTL